jgi:hypothetical protein
MSTKLDGRNEPDPALRLTLSPQQIERLADRIDVLPEDVTGETLLGFGTAP